MYFSITIPTYGYEGKGAAFLDFNLKKISEQLFTDYEVIISDHSVDETISEVVKKWYSRLPKIEYVKYDIGRGIISPNLNNAIRCANGKYIKVLFQDDFLYNEYSLLAQHSFLSYHNEPNWAMTRFVHSNDGESYYRDMTPVWTNDIWSGNNLLGCPTGLTYKRRMIEHYFDNSLNWLMDCDFYMKMFFAYGEPHVIPYITTVNRTWGRRLTDTIPNDIREKELKTMFIRYAEKD